MKRLLALLALLATAAPASAFVEGGITQTLGSQSYSGTRAFGDFGDDFNFRPSFDLYHSDVSSGTYKTFKGRFGYDTKEWGAGFTLGGSPKTDGYSNTITGADFSVTLTPSGTAPHRRIQEEHEHRGEGLSRVDLGGSILHTEHRDDLQSALQGTRRIVVQRAKTASIGQTDLTVNGGLDFLDFLLSGEITVSKYDHDLQAISAIAARSVRLAGVNSIIQGFPKKSGNVRLELDMFPIVAPYISLTRTSFELDQPTSTAVELGASAGFDILELHGSVERYAPGGGQPGQTYVSLGANVRF